MPISIADIQAHPAEAMAALIETVNRLGEEIAVMKRDAKLDREDIRDLYAAIDEIEQIKPVKRSGGNGQKTAARLATIEYLLIANGNEPLTFSEIGKRLELGSRDGKKTTRKQNMTLLGKVIAADPRFTVFDSSTQKGRKMVRLEREYFEGKAG